ncbi:MAG: DUF6359 domain-containing protein [Clostridium sp.]|nr:DUF6359 domain-containing protein [Clostridium sp.]
MTQCAFVSCEKVELPVADVDVMPPASDVWDIPEDTGEGTAQSPYTVTDILRLSSSSDGYPVWVVGYVVGYVNRSVSNAVLGADGALQSNILIAADPEERNPEVCLPVELNSDKLHRGLSLYYNPDSLGRCLMVQAGVALYFRVAGLRGVKNYRWLGNGESFIPSVDQTPEIPDDGEEPQPPLDDDNEGKDDDDDEDDEQTSDAELRIDHGRGTVREGI